MKQATNKKKFQKDMFAQNKSKIGSYINNNFIHVLTT